MAKNSKHKLLLVTVFLMILLSSGAYSALIPNVQAAEPTAQEKAMAVLNDVVGLNVNEYSASLNAQLDNQFLSLPQKEADMSFMSSQGKLRTRCSFVNNTLRQIYISDIEGTPSLNQPTANVLDMAKGFLERYQNYAGDSFYGELRFMLGTVNNNQNMTKILGNVKFEVLAFSPANVDFIWTYTSENGVSAASKNVFLRYENGQLRCFLNTWPLYKIVGEPALSSEEAKAVALNASRGFSWKVKTNNGTLTVSDFKIESIGDTALSYLNYMDESSARGGDPFTLYPSWYVPLGFDKLYPGGVTGMTLRIWADTGEVSSMGPMVFGGTPPPDEKTTPEAPSQEPTMLSVPIAVGVIVGAAGVSLGGTRAGFSKLKSRKPNSPRFWGTLLCLSILFSIVITAVPKANASFPNPDGKAMIYASTYGQQEDEIDAAEEVCSFIESRFLAAGYNTTNAFGTNTTRSNVINWAQSMENEHHRVAMFHFGHMAGDNTRYFDNYQNIINDYDISPKTVLGKHFFVFMWTCMQGLHPNVGMPVAWTHRYDLGNDGFHYPDSGLNCFIGFEYASPVISNTTGSFQNYTYPGKWFIMKFYYYALDVGYSVNDALNIASCEFFSHAYDYSPLYTGFNTWWPYTDWPDEEHYGWNWGKMHVYGNGNIHLAHLYDFTVLAKDQYDNNFANKDVYVDTSYNIANTNALMSITGGSHTFWVRDFWEPGFTGYRYKFDRYTYDGNTNYNNPLTLSFSSSETVTAHFIKTFCPADANGDGNANQADYYYLMNSYPSTRGDDTYRYNSACDFNSDGHVDQNDLNYFLSIVPMIQLTVLACNQYGQPGYVPLYIDGQYVGTTPRTCNVTQGNHQIYVQSPLYEYYQGHYYVHGFHYYYYDSTYNYNNPMTLSITADKTVTAHYYTYMLW